MSQAQQIKVSDKVQGVIEKDIQNKVIGRREIIIKLFHIGTGTPSRKDIRTSLASLLNVPADLIVIRKISTSYGAGISIVRAHVYDRKEILEKFEPQYLLDRDAGVKKQGGQGGKQEKQ